MNTLAIGVRSSSFGVLALAVALIPGTAAPREPRNLAPNPSLEDNAQGIPWTGGFVLDAGVACTGSHSAKLDFSADRSPSLAIGDLTIIEPQ